MTPNYAPNPTPLTPDKAKGEGEATVTMLFPVDVLLTRDDHQRVLFKAGVQEVPESLVSHSWLEKNGVKKYEKPADPIAQQMNATMIEEHVLFLIDKGYKIDTVEEAQGFFDRLEKDWVKAGFLRDFDAWKAAQGAKTT